MNRVDGRGPGLGVPVAPLAPLALALVVGIVADRYVDPFGTRVWAALALAGGAVAFGCGRRSVPAALGLVLAFGGLGGGWHHHRWSDLAPDDLARGVDEIPRPAWVRGVLSEVLGIRPGEGPGDRATTRAVLEVTAISDGRVWRSARARTQLVIAGSRPELEAGQGVMAAGSLAAIAGPRNPGEFDYRGHQRAQGVRLRLAVDDPEGVWGDDLSAAPRSWTRGLGSVRAWSHARLLGELDPAVAPLAAALLLGHREGVSPEVNDAFARTGTTHLLAISGLHLQVLAGVLWFVFRALGLGRRGAFAAVALATIGYALLVGLMPSVVRSAAMTVTVCAAGFCDRRPRPANTLALAALVTLGLNPAHLFDVGCQLSFLAIAAIVWGVGPVSNVLQFAYYAATIRWQGPGSPLDTLERSLEPWWLSRMRRWPLLVTAGLVVSVVVWLAALPLVALRFHVVAPIGILLNVPLIPLTSLALMASGLTLALSAVSSLLASGMAWLSATCLAWTETLVRWGASRSWGHAFVAGPSWGWVLVAYLLLGVATVAGVLRIPRRRLAWGVLAAWLVLGAAQAMLPRPGGRLEADVLAVGHGLAVVVRTAGGRALLYDCGRMHDPSVGRRIIAPALWSRGIGRLEAVILSHADADHYNGLPDLLERFPIAEVRVPPGFAGPANPGAARLLAAVRARGVAVRPIAAGDRWEWAGGARFSVWHPAAGPAATATSDNARSVVLDVESEGRHLLLTGDLEREGLDRLLTRPPPRRLDALLAPHHGGRTANPERLYGWARPGLVVVSQRPPAAGTRDPLSAVEARGIPVLRSWQRGAIRLSWQGGRLAARGFLDENGPGLAPALAMAWLGPGWSRGLAAVAGLVLGLAACFVMTVSEWGAWALVMPGRRLSTAGVEADAELDRAPGEPIEAVARDGTRLAGLWYPAESPAPVSRTVLLVHGFAEIRDATRGRSEYLTRRGWNVARVDLRGYGRSGGDLASFGGREGDDLRAWIDALAEKAGSSVPLAVWGRSMGAAIALRAAAVDPRIAAVVLESPYARLEPVVAGWLKRLRLPGRRVLATLIVRRAGRLAGVSLSRPSPMDLAPRIAAACLVVHGTEDTLVPLSDARRLAAAFPHPAPVLEVAGAGHGSVVEVGGVDLLDRIAGFLEQAVEDPG